MMENKTIRKEALNWFRSKFETKSDEIYTSKFYTPKESWNNSRVWFFQIPLDVIYSPVAKKIHLICENHLKGEPFIYFKVSSLFFLKNLKSFDVDQKEKVVRIYLSAEAVNMFTEVRGKGKIEFKAFRII
ncbi:MAG TPA: hypothetical protein VIM07_12600 [Chitinophagaceae bacterium]